MLRRLLLSLPLAAALPALATCPANNVLTTPTADLTDNGDGTVTHSKTGLMWKQCAEGLSDATCSTGSASSLDWAGALAAAKNSAFAGYSDWRLPNQKELASIVENGCYSPAINATRFPNTPSTWFWSSTSYAAVPANAWFVYFGNGYAGYGAKNVDNAVRLVRGGQWLGSFDQRLSYTPNAITFTNQSGVTASSTITSAGVTLAGLATPTGIQVSNGSYAVNGGSYTSAPGVVVNGDVLTLRHTASASASTLVTTTVTVGGVGGSFASTTAAAADNTPPALSAVGVSGTTATATTFSAISDEAATGYWVVLPTAASAPSVGQVKLGQDSTNAAAPFSGNAAMLAATAKTFAISGLTAGTGYQLYFVAADAVPNDTARQTVSFTTSAAITVPGAPTGVSASAGNGQATVSFSAPASNGGSAILGYTVVSSPAGGVDAQADSTATTHTVTGLTNGTPYTFTVTARNSAGSSSDSTASSGVTPSAPVVYAPPADPAPTPTELTVSGGALSISGGLPVRIGSDAVGATLTMNTAAPVTFTLNGSDISVQATAGSVLTVKQISVGGKNVLVLALTQGSVSLTATQAGQALLALGDVLLQAGSAGTVINAGTSQVAVSSGSLTLAGNAFAALKDGTLYAGEVAKLNAAGKISSIRLGSADGSGKLAGDALALSGQASGLSLKAVITRLGGNVGRLPDGLEKVVATALGGSGSQNASGTLVVAGSQPRYLLPLGDITVDTDVADGASTTADGLTRAAKNGVVVTLAPAPRDLNQFAKDLAQAVPGATLTLLEGGVLVARLAGRDYVVRPAAEVEGSNAVAGDLAAFASSDGVLRYRDGQGGQQALYPAFLNYPATLSLLESLASGVSATAKADGSISVKIGADSFTLTPDPLLPTLDAKNIPHVMSGEKWWLGEDGRVYLNGNGGVQGVGVK